MGTIADSSSCYTPRPKASLACLAVRADYSLGREDASSHCARVIGASAFPQSRNRSKMAMALVHATIQPHALIEPEAKTG